MEFNSWTITLSTPLEGHPLSKDNVDQRNNGAITASHFPKKKVFVQ